jgi:hypothetical protein
MVRQGVLRMSIRSGSSRLFGLVGACLGLEVLESTCLGLACQAGVRLPALAHVVAERPAPAVAADAVEHPIDRSVHSLHRDPFVVG